MFIIFRKKKIVENTYLNPLIDTMDFICIKINFSIHILQVLSHKTHCCRHKLYLFWITLHIVANFPNRISSLIYYNDHTMAIYIHFCISTAKFSMFTTNQFLSLKPSITSFLHLSKVSSDCFSSKSMETIFWWKGRWLRSLYLPDGSFPMIPRNSP